MTHTDLEELQKRLVKTIVDFGKEKSLDMKDIDRIDFNIDCPSCSIEFGEWHPGSDSCIALFDAHNKCLDSVM